MVATQVAVVGVSVGAAAGMYAAIKDPAVDAFVPISMPTTAHQYWQAALQVLPLAVPRAPPLLGVAHSVGLW